MSFSQRVLRTCISLAVLSLVSTPVLAAGSNMPEVKVLKPDGGMPIWYYNCERLFRYPIPTNFDFAYIDTSGKIVSREFFIIANDFNSGVAVVKMPIEGKHGDIPPAILNSIHQGQHAIVDTAGKVTRVRNMEVKDSFYGDLGVGYFNRALPGQEFRPHYDLINQSGVRVTHFKWKEAKDYSEGLVAVKGEEEPANAIYDAWGYRDKENKQVIPAKFYQAERFSEGLAAVCTEPHEWGSGGTRGPEFYHSERYSYIDKTGKVVIAGPFFEALTFKNGLAAVMEKKWQMGLHQ